MQMTENEIIRSYKEAPEGKKQKQIKILSELNACDKKTIREILRKGGFDIKEPKNRYTMAKEAAEVAEADGSERKRLIKNEEPTESSNLSAPEDPGKTMLGDSLEAKKTEEVGTCQQDLGTKSEKSDSSNLRSRIPTPPEVIDAVKRWLRSYEEDIEELEQKKKVIDEELENGRKTAERIRAWLAIEDEIKGKVTCSSCRHLAQEEMQGQAAPVSICRSKIWDGLHKAPHLIGHDTEKPILCNHWEGGEDG